MAEGTLSKMLAWVDPGSGGLVHYGLELGDEVVPLNPRVGGDLSIRFTGTMICVSCGKKVNKFFGQGFCWNCFSTAPEAAECIVRPELCRAHLLGPYPASPEMGGVRDAQWELEHHCTGHTVYLSLTGGIKVGVTRDTQVPVRWIDQGAVAAVVIARTPYRQLAGLIEVELKKTFADKTNWRAMLGEVRPDADALLAAREQAIAALGYELGAYAVHHEAPLILSYPSSTIPPKVNSISLEKEPAIAGTLAGIKGQYLVFADGRAFNVRNHSGYHITLN